MREALPRLAQQCIGSVFCGGAGGGRATEPERCRGQDLSGWLRRATWN